MTSGPEEHLLERMSALCDPLHVSLESSAEEVVEVREERGWGGRRYAWLGTHMTRAGAHRRLEAAPPDGWEVVGCHARNGELWLRSGLMTLRLLHTVSETDVPPPGPNRARQAFYANPPLPGLERPQLALLDVSRLLGLWRVVDEVTSRVGIRIVRPVGKWTYRQRAKTDIDLVLPRDVDEFAGLAWTPDDRDMGIEIPAEEGQEGEEGGQAE